MSEADLQRLRALTSIKWNWFDSDVLPAWVADMDLPPAPVTVEAVRSLVDRGDFGYNFHAAMQLPEVFSAWEESRHGWRPDPERVRVLCDVMQAIDVALMVHCGPCDGVIVFTPIYPPFLGSATAGGRRLIDCPLDPPGWRLDPERLAAAAAQPHARAILLANPHNPTGRVFSAEELGAIADAAQRHDLLIISDEIWCDVVHPNFTHIPVASLSEDAAARTVTLSAASKAFNVAGLHCAVAHVGHGGVREAIGALPGHVLGAVGSPGAEAALAAWTRGEEWLDQTRAHLTAMRDHAAARLAAELPAVRFTLPDATYLAWLDVSAFALGDDCAKTLLDEARVGLSSGIDFGEHGAGFVRLNFATTQPILDEVLDRIVKRMSPGSLNRREPT
jgi:cystathionine beta-lyase